MKNSRYLLLSLFMVFVLAFVAACGGDSDDDTDTAIDAEPTEEVATAPDNTPEPAATEADPAATEAETAADTPEPAATPAEAATNTPEPAATDDDPVEGETLRIGWMDDYLSLDPTQMRDSLATELGYHIYSSLVRIQTGTTDVIVGDLATDWEVSEDGLEYTFYLNENATWHGDYGAVTAEDVQYSMLRHKDEDVASVYTAESALIADVEVVDQHTVKIHTTDPWPGFLTEFLAYRPGFIVNQQAIEELGERYDDSPVGSGAFMLQEWRPGESVTLHRNDNFYGDAGMFQEVVYLIITEEATMEIALERGEIDIAYFLNPEIQTRLQNHDQLMAENVVAPRTFYLQLNHERSPLDDVRVRQAMWYAIDKELIVEAIMLGLGAPTDTMLNPHVPERLDEIVYGFQPDVARELLAEAGYDDSEPLEFIFWEGDINADLAVALQDMWRDVGMNIELVLRDSAQTAELRRSGNFDISMQRHLRLGADQYLTPLMHSQSMPFPQSSRYSNPVADEMIDRARSTMDNAERTELYHEIQRLAHQDVPFIPLVNPLFTLAFQPDLEGAIPGLQTINVTEIRRVSE